MEDSKELKTIIRAVIDTHESVERLKCVVKQAVEDKRFRMSLADNRMFRDLVNDMEIMLSEAGQTAVAIPLDLPFNGKKQEVNKGFPQAKTSALK